MVIGSGTRVVGVADNLNDGVRICIDRPCNGVEVILQATCQGRAVGRKEDILRHGDDQLVARVHDARLVAQLLTQFSFLKVELTPAYGTKATANSSANDRITATLCGIVTASRRTEERTNTSTNNRTRLRVAVRV